MQIIIQNTSTLRTCFWFWGFICVSGQQCNKCKLWWISSVRKNVSLLDLMYKIIYLGDMHKYEYNIKLYLGRTGCQGVTVFLSSGQHSDETSGSRNGVEFLDQFISYRLSNEVCTIELVSYLVHGFQSWCEILWLCLSDFLSGLYPVSISSGRRSRLYMITKQTTLVPNYKDNYLFWLLINMKIILYCACKGNKWYYSQSYLGY
jgi:hypothetical protein